MNSIIYLISWTNNHYFYIGQAQNFKRRKSQHLHHLKKNNHFNKRLQRVFSKYGQPNFHIIEECDVEELNEREQFYLDLLFNDPNCLNLAKCAEVPARGLQRSDETKQKMSEVKKGRKFSDEHKQKMSEAHKGRKHSEERRQKLSKAHKRKKPIEQYSKEGKFIKLWASIVLAARELGIHASNISKCVSGKKKRKTAGGYVWKYKK